MHFPLFHLTFHRQHTLSPARLDTRPMPDSICIRPRDVEARVPLVAEDEVADVGEHDFGLVARDHVAGAEDVVV